MLKNFDAFCESLIIEGRKSDDKKKFKINIEKAKKHIDEIGTKHHHYVHDKGHFTALLDEFRPDAVYTPRTFIDDIKSAMKGKGKGQIADGYAKLLYSFLNDRVDSPFENHDPEAEVEEEKEDVPDAEFDSISPEIENSAPESVADIA
jgi:hypothetical protein